MRASERMRASGSLRHGSRPWPMLLSPARTAGTPTSSRPTSRESGAGARRARRCSRSPNRPHRRPRDRPRLRAGEAPPAPAPRPAPSPAILATGTGLDQSSIVGKIVFNCPTCGHGYRLATKLAGKQGRCTACRGVFTIPIHSPPPVPAGAPQSSPSPVRQPPGRALVAAPPVAGDSGWWELDSSEAIPAPPARAGGGRAAAAVAAVPPASGWTTYESPEYALERPTRPSRPPRPAWVTPAAIGGGVLLGVVAIAIIFTLVSRTSGPASAPPVADQPAPESNAAPPESVADTSGPSSRSAPEPRRTAVEQHREAVDALIRAYNEIAEGYARIRDADSIRQGSEQVTRASERLKSSAQRGRTLPALPPSARQELASQTGVRLLEAVDRVLAELQRLKATPGLRLRLRPPDRRIYKDATGDSARDGTSLRPGGSLPTAPPAGLPPGCLVPVPCAHPGCDKVDFRACSMADRPSRPLMSRTGDVPAD